MKQGTDSPDAGSVVTTTKTTRIVPTASEKIDFWEYLSALHLPDAKHILYLYRNEPGGPDGRSVPLGKFVDFSVIPWNDQEEAELTIMQKYGGRIFRVIVKCGHERVCDGKIYNDAPPRAPQVIAQETPPQTNQAAGFQVNEGTATERVASQAISTIAGVESQGARIGMEALAAAGNVIARFAAAPAPAAGTSTSLTDKFMDAMITKMLNPPPAPDPIALLKSVLEVQNQLSGGPGINPLKNFSETVEMLKTFGVTVGGDKAPAVSAGAELVRSLPSIGQQILNGIHEYRLMMEAQRDHAMAMQRGAQPPPNGEAARPSLQAPPAPQAAPAPVAVAPPPNGASTPMPSFMDLIEIKIVEILAEPQSAEWCAEETLMFLDRMDKNIVPQLASQGETGLMNLFTTRPLLKPATANAPRLTEFIRAFLKHAGENAGDGTVAAAKPN